MYFGSDFAIPSSTCFLNCMNLFDSQVQFQMQKKTFPLVTLTISVKAHPSKRNELSSTFELITDKTRQAKGCLSCHLFHDIDNENLINIEETWERRSYLAGHFRSDIFSALLGAVKLLGETHEIRINRGSQTEGLEAVQTARSRTGMSDQ